MFIPQLHTIWGLGSTKWTIYNFLFLYFRLWIQLTVNLCWFKTAICWIWKWVLWIWNCLLCQLCQKQNRWQTSFLNGLYRIATNSTNWTRIVIDQIILINFISCQRTTESNLEYKRIERLKCRIAIYCLHSQQHKSSNSLHRVL